MAFTSGYVWGLAGFCSASGTGGGVRNQALMQALALFSRSHTDLGSGLKYLSLFGSQAGDTFIGKKPA